MTYSLHVQSTGFRPGSDLISGLTYAHIGSQPEFAPALTDSFVILDMLSRMSIMCLQRVRSFLIRQPQTTGTQSSIHISYNSQPEFAPALTYCYFLLSRDLHIFFFWDLQNIIYTVFDSWCLF